MSINVEKIEEAVSRLSSLAIRSGDPRDAELAEQAAEELAKVRRLIDGLRSVLPEGVGP